MGRGDTALLKRWSARRDSEAFDELVSRYADQVYSTCLRILRNDADAEDVSQECFLRLAQSPVDVHTSLGGWLHRVATTKSLDRIRKESRRRSREGKLDVAGAATAPAIWDDVQAEVDAAIDTLPDELRLAIVAHFLERKTHSQIAREFGIHRRTVSWRIQKGLGLVRERLRSRGVTLGGVAIAALLADVSAKAAPTTLKVSLGKLAIAAGSVSGAGGGTANSVLLGSLMIMKTRIAAVGVVVCLLAVGFAYVTTRHGDDAAPGSFTARPIPADTGQRVVKGIIDAVPASSTGDHADDTPTLEDLLALSQAELARALEHYPAIENAEDYGSVSGVVLDRNSYAIPGATVTLVPTLEWSKIPGVEQLALTATSGVDGWYRIEDIAHSGGYRVCASKPGYVSAANFAGIEPGTDARADFTLQDGLSLEGRVLTASGTPVPDGFVFYLGVTGPRRLGPDLSRATQTDPQGWFALGLAEDDRGSVAAVRVRSAAHGASTFADILVQDERPIELRLTESAVIRGTVRNRKGKPLPGAHVKFFARKIITTPRADGASWDSPSYAGQFVAVCDDSGRYATEVDSGMDYQAMVEAPGAADKGPARDVLTALQAGETREYNPVVNTDTITVRAAIVGQQTGKPFSSYVMVDGVAIKDGNVVAVSKQDGHFAIRFVFLGEPGEYSFQARYMDNPELVGDVSGPYKLKSGKDIEITLNLPEPQSFSVRVVDPDGEPVAGAAVQFRMEGLSGIGTYGVTNSEGRLDEPILLAPGCGAQVCVAMQGYATAWGTVLEDQGPGMVHPEEVLVLWPGAGFEGDLLDVEGNPMPDTVLTITVTNSEGRVWPFEANTDSSGHFTIGDQAPADTVDITLHATTSDGIGASWGMDRLTLEAAGITNLGAITFDPEK